MIPSKQEEITVRSNITDSNKISMTLDENSLVHLMGVLTDLYSDPEMAVIREYSTNAYDAHVEAGVTRPIEVDLPTYLAKVFTVRDYGVGLTMEDIERIYSKYGASTKRETNTQSGVLGLGCKSALTYTNQFTVSSVKDGRRIQAIVSRDEDGAGFINVISDKATNDVNGTIITVPVKDANTFNQKAEGFFLFWKKGTVLLNGVEPKRIDGYKFSDNLITTKDIPACMKTGGYYGRQDYVIMGNVPYPTEIDVRLQNGASIVTWVEIGDVDFTPSREALYMSKKTKAKLEEIKTEFNSLLKSTVETDIASCKHGYEVLPKVLTWTEFIPPQKYGSHWDSSGFIPNLIFKGKKIGNQVDLGQTARYLSRHSYRKTDTFSAKNISLEGLSKCLFIYNTPVATSLTGTLKNKVEHWINAQNPRPNYSNFVFIDKKPAKDQLDWINPNQFIDFPTIKAVVVPKYTSSYSTGPIKDIKGSYPGQVAGVWHEEIDANDIKPADGIYYYNKDTISKEDHVVVRRIFHYFFPKAQLIHVFGNRVDKFCRDFPKAEKVDRAFVKTLHEKFIKSLTANVLMALAEDRDTYYSHEEKQLRQLDFTKVSDPELVAFIQPPTYKKVDVSKEKAVMANFRYVGHVTNLPTPRHNGAELLQRYPLFNYSVFRSNPDHIYMYLNCTYRSLKKDD